MIQDAIALPRFPSLKVLPSSNRTIISRPLRRCQWLSPWRETVEKEELTPYPTDRNHYFAKDPQDNYFEQSVIV